eukprot:TRINITY_DN1121_c0_g1_i2.p1 TRINITY_DN1121_c0_g1~~TRINITY_DN1121_c0_g1_i2.p1  ORF type:complete len:625 (+),score=122.08 TRINITY_DN1121_c0_g1_i2:133-2007(+)
MQKRKALGDDYKVSGGLPQTIYEGGGGRHSQHATSRFSDNYFDEEGGGGSGGMLGTSGGSGGGGGVPMKFKTRQRQRRLLIGGAAVLGWFVLWLLGVMPSPISLLMWPFSTLLYSSASSSSSPSILGTGSGSSGSSGSGGAVKWGRAQAPGSTIVGITRDGANVPLVKRDLYEVPKDVAPKWDAFMDWLIGNGAVIDASKITLRWTGPERGYGLFTTAALPADEVVMQIPSALTFHGRSEHSLTKRHWDLAQEKGLLEGIGNLTMTAATLLVEMHSGRESFWSPWWPLLPDASCPHFYAPSTFFGETQSGPVVWNAEKASAYIRAARDHMEEKLMPYLLEHDSTLFTLSNGHSFYDSHRFDIAASTLLQRSFSMDHNWGMVPFLEYINSKLEWNEEENQYQDINGYSTEDDMWVERTSGDMTAGEELVGVYATKSTTLNYLLQYGFVTEDNKNDYVTLKLDLTGIDPTVANGINTEHSKHVYSDFVVSPDFVRSLATALMDPKDPATYQLSEPTEEMLRSARYQLKRAIHAHLQAKPTTLAQDYATLASGSLPPRTDPDEPGIDGRMMALLYRIEAKKFIARVVEHIDTQQAASSQVSWDPADDYFAIDEITIPVAQIYATIHA